MMSRRMTAILLAASLGLSIRTGSAWAATFSIVPANPTTRDVVYLRLQSQGCGLDAWDAQVDHAAHVVRFRLMGDDTCAPDNIDSLTPLGYLKPGLWRYEIWSCENGLLSDPNLFCGPNNTPPVFFTVQYAGSPNVIPTLSKAVALLLTAFLALFAASRLRNR